MITIKVTKKQGFILSLENKFLYKSAFLELKNVSARKRLFNSFYIKTNNDRDFCHRNNSFIFFALNESENKVT